MSFTRRPGSGRPRQTSHREDRHIRQIEIQLSSEHSRVRGWRPRGEHLNPPFALQRHTALTAGVMAWGVIAYNTWSPLVLIRGITWQPSRMSMTSCNHMCCHSCNGSQESFFKRTMLGFTRQGCHKTVSAQLPPFLGLPDPQISLQ
ncbi:transposable element Tcb2 transposase [Trichonephila clavipes]|nr:transposable element Tcb2 transposase [Trichonephila clavipes]